MNTTYKPRWGHHVKALLIAMAIAVVTSSPSGQLYAYPKGTDPHAQLLGGPYELLVQRGMQGAGMVFPVDIENQQAPCKLQTELPVMGTSAKIILDSFLPELIWEQYVESSKEGGFVVRLKAQGPDLQQDIWLCSYDKAKQSILSVIGGITIKQVPSNADLTDIAGKLVDPNAVGILSVHGASPNDTEVHVVRKDSIIQMADESAQFKVMDYFPHYSVDPATGTITNASQEPKNPAIKVQFTQAEKTVEQWLFARFATHPHIPNKLPVTAEFTEIDLSSGLGSYIMLVSGSQPPQMLTVRQDQRVAEPAKPNTSYPLAREGYQLVFEEIFSDSVLKQRWKNNRNQLLNPAIIATVDRDGEKEQVVLELNKPQHVRTGAETMVLLLRRKVENAKHLE